jgi:hypothetical protein
MQIKRFLDEQRDVMHTTIVGEITWEKLRVHMSQAAADSSYNPALPALVDLRNATSQLTADEIIQLVKTLESMSPRLKGARRALLVDSDLMYGLYRMFEAFSVDGPLVCRAFRDEQEAWDWISRKEPGAG